MGLQKYACWAEHRGDFAGAFEDATLVEADSFGDIQFELTMQ